jgi:hypothetical protein
MSRCFSTRIPLFISASDNSALLASQEKLVPCQPFGRCAIPSGRSFVHSSIRPEDVPYHPDARQTKASSVRTTWISVRTSSASRSFCSGLHRSGCLSSPIRQLLVIELQISFQVQMREDYCNRPDELIHKVRIAIQIKPFGCQSGIAQTRALQIWKLRVEDQPSRRPSSWSGRAKP